MKKALALDMGGVIITLDIKAAIRAFKEKAGFENVEEYLDPFFQKGFLNDYEAGLVDESEFLRILSSQCREGTTFETILDCYADFLPGIDAEKVPIIKALAEKYDLYLLSNNNFTALERVCKPRAIAAGLDFDKLFIKQFNSFEMHLLKPSPEMYQAVIAGIGREPGDIIFLDDSEKNVAGAIACGIDARLFRSVEDMKALLY